MTRLLRACSSFVLLLCVAGTVFSHDNQLLDFMGPYLGPGFSGSATTALGGSTTSGAASLDFPRNNMTLLSWIPLPGFGPEHENGNDCWGYTSTSGTEYAIMGLHAGTSFVDLSDPGDPQIVATLPGAHSLWRDMKVYQHYCYAVSEGTSGTGGNTGGGLQVMDMSLIDSGVVSLVNTVLTPGTENTHNVAIDEVSGFLYRTGGVSRGLRVYDLTNPASPAFVGAYDDRYFHDAQIVTYTAGVYTGRQIAFCAAGTGAAGFGDPSVDIVDVTDKQNMFLVKRVYYPNPAYSHQVWLSEDRQLLYINDELDENGVLPTTTHVMDVSDLDAASYVASFDNGNTAIGHNLYTANGLIYEGNYRSGVRVFDTLNPLAPNEIAYFDTYLEDDNANFNGVWSVFPYFQSGVIVVSDVEKGLFLLWVGDPLLEFTYPNGVPTTFDSSGTDFAVQITEHGGGLIEAGTPTLHLDLGAGFVPFPMTALGGGSYSATVPPTACGASVPWFVSARSTNGILWKDPDTAPSVVHSALIATSIVTDVSEDGESTAGWTVGASGDSATTGVWENGEPIGTQAQPGGDHSPDPGTRCWVTGLGAVGGAVGDADVDGGATTLVSPLFDLAAADSGKLRYWRWYSNDLFTNVDDTFLVEISDDAGASWFTLESLGPLHPEASGGWFQADFLIENFVSLTDQVQLRFIAEDTGAASFVEAAIDDLTVMGIDCTPAVGVQLCSGDGGDQSGCTNCPCGNNALAGTLGGCLNSAGTSARLLAEGDASVSLPSGSATDLRFALSGAPASAFCILNSGDAVAPTSMGNPCFGLNSGAQALQFDGLRCAVQNTRRHGGRSADSNGEVGVSSAPWGGEGAPPAGLALAGSGFVSGQSRAFQVIHRDDPMLSCGRGLNTSQAWVVTFLP